MVVTANTTKYTIENDLTKKRKKKKKTNKHTDKIVCGLKQPKVRIASYLGVHVRYLSIFRAKA